MRAWFSTSATKAKAKVKGKFIDLTHSDLLFTVDKTKLSPKTDLEDIEYTAQLLSVYQDLEAVPSEKAVLFTVEIPDLVVSNSVLRPVPDDGMQGIQALNIAAETSVKLLCIHVTEHSAKTILNDEYEPELLWFDVSESEDALSFAAS